MNARNNTQHKTNRDNTWLGKLAMRYQISLLAAVGLIGLIAVGITFYISSIIQENAQDAIDRATIARDLVRTVQVDLLQARRAEKDFFLRAEEKYVARHEAVAQNAIANLRDLAHRIAEVQRNDVDAVRAEVEVYRDEFERAVAEQRALGLDEESGLQGALRQSVHRIEEKLKAFDEPRLMVQMLMMRRHEKDFLARRDPKYGDRMRESAAAFETTLRTAPLPFADRQEMSDELAAYQRDFFAVLERAATLASAQEALSASYARAEPLLEAMVETIEADYKAAGASVTANRETTSTVLFTTIALTIVAGAGAAFVIGGGIVRPIVAMTVAMRHLAGGDITTEIPARGRKDEIGQMADAVQVFKDNAVERRRLEAEQQEEQTRKEARRQAIERHIRGFDETVTGALSMLASAATEMRTTAESMSMMAEETARQSTAVAAASEQASVNVQTVASAADELSASVTEIGRQMNQAAGIATNAVEEAGRADAAVQGLAEAAQRIDHVVNLISAIAGQTNLLALNATIEAARAGEAGKGFAVVASEVKALANQTAKATEEIAQQISAMQAATGGSVRAIQGVGAVITQINEIAASVASAVEEQDGATREISRNINEAAKGTSVVSANITGVTQAAGETGAAAAQVLGTAGELSRQSESLRTEVDKFLANIRAA